MKDIKIRDLIEILIVPLFAAAVYFIYDLSKNVNEMNVKLGVVLSKNESLEKRVDKLEDKFESFQQKHK